MRYLLSGAALAIIAVLAWVWWGGGFDQLGTWAAAQQRDFQNAMARALRAARAGEAGAVMALLGACFAYGLAHAAGPGHGKVLLGGYGFARKVPMVRLSVIALLASLGQAVTAIAIIYGVVIALDIGRRAITQNNDAAFAALSYLMIGAIGLWLVWRGGRKLWAARHKAHDHGHHHSHHHGHDHDHAEDGVCASCGHAHGPTLEQVDQVNTLREAVALVLAIAIRPCTGALFVLILTWQMGIPWLGIFGALAMAVGTALITIGVGLAASGLRGGVLAGLGESAHLARAMAGLEVLAGSAIALIAFGLVMRGF